jgi:hypothetical protein
VAIILKKNPAFNNINNLLLISCREPLASLFDILGNDTIPMGLTIINARRTQLRLELKYATLLNSPFCAIKIGSLAC